MGQRDVDPHRVMLAIVSSQVEEVVGASDNLCVHLDNVVGSTVSSDSCIDGCQVVTDEVLLIFCDLLLVVESSDHRF